MIPAKGRHSLPPPPPSAPSAPHSYSSTVALIDKRSIAAHNLRANHTFIEEYK